MTAIVAYAERGFSFVAGDSCRVSYMLPTVKVHTWGPSVVFAQAGNGIQQSQLIANMMTYRGSCYSTDLAGFESAFTISRSGWHAAAIQAHNSNQKIDINGTLLVADAESGEISSYDFATGNKTKHNPIGAAGFHAVHASAASAWNGGRKDLDLWAIESISSLCGQPGIAWPIDMLISRTDRGLNHLVMAARIDASILSGSSHFLLP